MSENPRTQTKVGMKYGLIYGVASIALSLIFYLTGTDLQAKLPQYLNYGVLLGAIILGIRSFRDEDLGGYISYGKSLGTGVVIAFFGSIIVAFYTYLFFNVVDPALIDQMIEMTREKMIESGMPDDQVEMAVDMSARFMTPGWMFTFSILGITFMGFVFSLLASVFLKRNQDNPFNTMQ
jgi:hypothetical protein